MDFATVWATFSKNASGHPGQTPKHIANITIPVRPLAV
jgi:hypothetical protein